MLLFGFLFQAECGILDLVRSRGLGDVYKRQADGCRQPVGGAGNAPGRASAAPQHEGNARQGGLVGIEGAVAAIKATTFFGFDAAPRGIAVSQEAYVFPDHAADDRGAGGRRAGEFGAFLDHDLHPEGCLLYTSDAADGRSSVDLGGRRILKKKNQSTPPGSTCIISEKQATKTRA